jgi:two-component system, OmpR family, response regulator
MAVDWTQLKVLIADDQRFILGILFHILKELGVKSENIHQATNGDEAEKMLAALPVDVAMCDINMGPGNGLLLLRNIRTGLAQVPTDLPFIFLTGHSDVATVQVARALDANGFLVKPVTKKQFQEKIDGVLTNRKPLPPGKNYAAVIVELSDSVKAAAAMDGTSGRHDKPRETAEDKPGDKPSGS